MTIMVIIYYDTSVGSPYSVTFLSQLSYDNYYESEERFTGELTAYTRKQFFEVWLDSPVLKAQLHVLTFSSKTMADTSNKQVQNSGEHSIRLVEPF